MPNWLVYLIVGVIFALFVVVLPVVYTLGIRQGQIQALNGDIEYELVEQENSTMRWRKILE